MLRECLTKHRPALLVRVTQSSSVNSVLSIFYTYVHTFSDWNALLALYRVLKNQFFSLFKANSVRQSV